MSSNISDILPNKYDNPGEKVRKTSGDLDETEKSLVATTYTVDKEGNTEMVDKKSKTKPNVGKESITYPVSSKKNIDTVKKR